jgi:hypothetical protein
MRTDRVVVADETVEVCLERADRGDGRVLAGEELLFGLVEPFDFAAGLGVIRPRVLEGDAEASKGRFHRADAVAVRRGEHRTVVGEQRGRITPVDSSVVEAFDDVGRFEDSDGTRGDAESGVVVDDVEDLDEGPVGDADMGHVGLPAFVGEIGDEADIGAARPFVWLGSDEPSSVEDAPDRRR